MPAGGQELTDEGTALDADVAEEYRRDMEERGGGWTAQAGTGYQSADPGQPHPDTLVANQLFIPEQLPDEERLRDAGFRPNMPDAYILEDEEAAFSHPLGPDVVVADRARQREAVNERLRETVADSPQERAAMTAGGGDLDPDDDEEGDLVDDDDEDDDYEDSTLDELREDLRARGLPTSGNKSELIERLRA